MRSHGLVVMTLVLVALPMAHPASASPESTGKRGGCAAKSNPHAPEAKQEGALRCLINKARSRHGSATLRSYGELERAAGRKAGDVARCGFSHNACGRAADARARQTGYVGDGRWRWGENLAKGRSRAGTAKRAVKAWMNSGPHRATMLTGAFEHLGVGLKRQGRVAIWVLQLGCKGC